MLSTERAWYTREVRCSSPSLPQLTFPGSQVESRLAYPCPPFPLLLPFNLFITGPAEEHRKRQDQAHWTGHSCFPFLLPPHHTEHTTLRRGAAFLRATHGLGSVLSSYWSNIPTPLVFILTSKYFNNNATKCLSAGSFNIHDVVCSLVSP